MKDREIVFENNTIKVETTGRDYDFIATVENKTSEEVEITFTDDELEPFKISADDWIGLEACDMGYMQLNAFEEKRFNVATIEHTFDEIKAEIEQGLNLSEYAKDKDEKVKIAVIKACDPQNAEHRKILDNLSTAYDENVREAVAEKGYNLEKLSYDDKWLVRATVARVCDPNKPDQRKILDELTARETNVDVLCEIAEKGINIEEIYDKCKNEPRTYSQIISGCNINYKPHCAVLDDMLEKGDIGTICEIMGKGYAHKEYENHDNKFVRETIRLYKEHHPVKKPQTIDRDL